MEKSNKSGSQDLVIMGTSEIVAAFASSGTISPDSVGKLITEVHAALTQVCDPPREEVRREKLSSDGVLEKQAPAVPVDQTMQGNQLVCLECGEHFMSIKRHLKSAHNLSPEEYREKWELPANYPMISPAYSETRSTLAKDMGLGAKVGKSR